MVLNAFKYIIKVSDMLLITFLSWQACMCVCVFILLLILFLQVQQISEGMDAKVRYVRGPLTSVRNAVQRVNAELTEEPVLTF